MNAIIIKDDKVRFPVYIRKEQKERLVVYKIRSEKGFVKKMLLKKINKDRILNIATDNNISRTFGEYFRGKTNVVTKEEALFSNIDKIVLKAASSVGIKDGQLTLGIIPKERLDIALRKIEKVANKLKNLYIYSDNPKEFFKEADLFYQKTGIPVILKNGSKSIECDILLCLKRDEISHFDFNGMFIDIFDATNRYGIRDVKIKFKDFSNEYDISDSVISKILSEPFEIDSFITKNA